MAKTDLRIGLVGMGAIGPPHIHAIGQTAGCRLAAVCDVRPEAAAAAGATHGVPHFTAVSDMLQADRVDAVSICTPSGYHLDAALPAIAAGKHVLVEKPMEVTPERIDRIIEAAAARGVTLAGVYQSRFTPLSRELKGLVAAGLLGTVYSGSAYTKRYRTQEYYDSGNWRGTWEIDGGGCLMNQGIHLVDLFAWFMDDVTEVRAFTATVGRERIDVETLAVALLKFAGGARGVVEATTLAYPELEPRIEIFGSRGTVAFNHDRLLGMDLLEPTPAEAAARERLLARFGEPDEADPEPGDKPPPGTPVGSLDMGHAPVFADFVEAIREGRDPLVTGAEARRAVELIAAIYASGREDGRPVRLQPSQQRTGTKRCAT